MNINVLCLFCTCVCLCVRFHVWGGGESCIFVCLLVLICRCFRVCVCERERGRKDHGDDYNDNNDENEMMRMINQKKRKKETCVNICKVYCSWVHKRKVQSPQELHASLWAPVQQVPGWQAVTKVIRATVHVLQVEVFLRGLHSCLSSRLLLRPSPFQWWINLHCLHRPAAVMKRWPNALPVFVPPHLGLTSGAVSRPCALHRIFSRSYQSC